MDFDLQNFKKLKIVFHSIKLKVKQDNDNKYVYKKDFPDRVEKEPSNIPKYANVKLGTTYIKGFNATMIPMGEVYNLIGIDIDDKNDTLTKYNELCSQNNFDRKTFTMKTMHDGIHEYFRLSDKQKTTLKDFKSLDGKIFGLNIDVKYNNQFLFGPSILGKNKEFKYSILKDHEPTILPEFLFNEIVNIFDQPKNSTGKLKILQPIKPINEITNIMNKKVDRLKIQELIDILSTERSEIRSDWLNLGFCLHNIDKSLLNMWIEFSKKSLKFKPDECENLWFQMLDTGLNIGTLHFWAKNDSPKKYFEYICKQIDDSEYSLECTNDDIAKIFYILKRNELVCAQVEPKKIWYLFKKGIWNRLEDNSRVRSIINKDLINFYKNRLTYINIKINEAVTDEEKNVLEQKKNNCAIYYY